jgi:hypothetical protein
VILSHSANEEDAVRKFWGLLDEYVKEHEEAMHRTSTAYTDNSAANECKLSLREEGSGVQ